MAILPVFATEACQTVKSRRAASHSECGGVPPLPPRLFEMPQVRWRLVFAGGRQLAVDAEVVSLPLDEDVVVVLGAAVLHPGCVTRAATIPAGDRPGPRQRVVDGRHLVTQDIRIGLVQINPFLDDGLIVLV